MSLDYWNERCELLYYRAVLNCVRIVGHDAQSLIDVGSAGCGYLGWYGWIPDVVSLDMWDYYPLPGVRYVKADFLKWTPDKRYDVVTCLQVMEHVDDAGTFARKLLDLGSYVLVSLPYKWEAGRVKSHVHDPVDQEKIGQWFGRSPDYATIVQEIFGVERILCLYNMTGMPLDLSSEEVTRRLTARSTVEEK